MNVKFWTAHPLHGGVEIPGELTEQDDGAFTFRPYLMPNSTVAEIYVSNEDGYYVTTLPISQLDYQWTPLIRGRVDNQ